MTGNEKCLTCGAPLSGDDPGGSCPRCLLQAALAESHPGDGRRAADAPSPEEIAPHFPRLEILELIGQGGMGIVYKARQVSLDRVVALKILPPSIASGATFAERFTREARTMARLDHENIVCVHEFGESEGLYYLVMEFVDGSNLREVMESGGLEPREALAIVPQICDALQFAHDQGVVHRDIKPENVLLTREGRVKITDFGLAKLLDLEPEALRITGTGQVMGTVHYMAPEQYRSPEEVDHRADIYSLGVVFYEMLTGELPMGRFSPPSEKVRMDVRLDEVVLRALEKEPERRYQQVGQVRTDVDSIVSTAPPPAPPQPAARPEGSRLSLLALFGFLCLPATFALPAIVLALAAVFSVGVPVALVLGLGFITLLTGFCLSLSAWISIARSRGALHGYGFAVAGTLGVPILLLLAGVMSLLYLRTAEPAELPTEIKAAAMGVE